MAATYNLRKTYSQPQCSKDMHTLEFEIDSTDTTIYGASGISTSEVVALYDIPAGSVILAAQLLVTTAQSTITDVDVGVHASGSADASLLDGVSLASTAYVGANSSTIMNQPEIVNSAKQLVFVNNDTQSITTGKCKVIILLADMRAK